MCVCVCGGVGGAGEGGVDVWGQKGNWYPMIIWLCIRSTLYVP